MFIGAALALDLPSPAATVPATAAVFRKVRRFCAFMGFPWAGLWSVRPKHSRIAPSSVVEFPCNWAKVHPFFGLFFPKLGKTLHTIPTCGKASPLF
jgi:hypothetical protein